MNSTPFPVSIEELRPLVAQAVLAPSSHNTQPWLWLLLEGSVTLFADRTRALPVNDPDDRELTMSCGAALLNLTMTEGVRTGYITADRCSTLTAGPQTRSNGNYTRNTSIANLAVVPLDNDGSFCIYTERNAHLLVDLQGTFAPTGALGFQRVDPTRLLDTRTS